MYQQCRSKCFLCLKTLDFDGVWYVDLINPSRGPVIVNGVTVCEGCHEKKLDLSYAQFVELHGGLFRVPKQMRCQGYLPSLIRCNNFVNGTDTYCCKEHLEKTDYVADNTEEYDLSTEEIDGRIFTKKDRKVIFMHCEGQCFYCLKTFELSDSWEADHLIPWSKDGATTAANGVVSCRDCNRRKSNMSHQDFIQKYGGRNGVAEGVRCHGFILEDNSLKRCNNFIDGLSRRQYCCDEHRKLRQKVRARL